MSGLRRRHRRCRDSRDEHLSCRLARPRQENQSLCVAMSSLRATWSSARDRAVPGRPNP